MNQTRDNTANTHTSLLMKNMTWEEYAARTGDILIIPIGSTEQHGPHLPLCVDTVLAEEFSLRIAGQLNGLAAPALSYGYKSKPFSGGGPLFPGTIDLNGHTLQLLIQDLIDEFVRDGFQKILLFNAHYENEPFILEAMDLCSARYKEQVTLWETNWWDCLPEEIIGQVFDEEPFPGWDLEHAAVTETSLMMYFRPELVRSPLPALAESVKVPFYHRYPPKTGDIPPAGILSSAASSSAEKGRIIAEYAVKSIAAHLKNMQEESI